jgi:Flp pilus assembly protein TadG
MEKTSYSCRGCLAVLYGGMASSVVGKVPSASSPGLRAEARSRDKERLNASRPGLARGETAVEFGMVAVLFFLLMFAVMDYGWIMFAQINVQQAVDDGGRFASTGNHSTVVSGGKPTTLSRLQSIITFIQNQISVPGVDVQSNLVACSTNGGCSNKGGSAPAGGPEDTVTLTLTTSLPLFTPALKALFSGGAYTFTASTSFKNEPFSPSQTN